MSKIHTMQLGGEGSRRPVAFFHRCLGCERKWRSELEEENCACGVAFTKKPPPRPPVDLLKRWMNNLGIPESRYTEIEDKFGQPARTCKGRKVWEKPVVKYLRGK